MMTEAILTLLCGFFIISIQGAPHYSRVSDVVDLENETEVHSLIEFLKYFLRKDRQAKSAVVTDEKRDDGESRSGRRGGSAYNIVNGGDGGYVVEKEPEEPLIQEATFTKKNDIVREYKYKVARYTEDHTRAEVDEDIRRGLDAWTNLTVNKYLRNKNCPTLRFTEAKPNEKVDFTINFIIGDWISDTELYRYYKRSNTIYINDSQRLKRDWIAHAVAVNTCKMLGCRRWGDGQEINKVADKDYKDSWNNYLPYGADFRTLASALGCEHPWRKDTIL